MAVENKSFAEAAQIKRSATVYKGLSYANVSNQHKVSFSNFNNFVQEANSNLFLSSFPTLSNSQPNYKKKRKNFHISYSNSPQFPSLQSQNVPSFCPNGSFFNFVDQSVPYDFNSNFIASLTEQLILQSSDTQIISPSSLKSLIGSSLLKFLSPSSDDDETY